MSKDLRKGAWTEEEDDLLRQCIFEYGEGRWHLVPSRSGLNRCRKSCRLRWLNYLHPNIKRGVFEEDEIDLILKLHRLLGNRWSLIARRLPGRTANDVKNYWNTHLNKKKKEKIIIPEVSKYVVGVEDRNTNNNLVKTNVIKPRPWTFSKTRPWVWKNRADSHDIYSNDKNTKLVANINVDVGDYNEQFLENGDDLSSSNDNWWKSLLYGGEEVVNNDIEECINAHMQHKIVTCIS